MAKLSILPFLLLLLAIALPLLLAMSAGARPTTIEVDVDCLQRPDESNGDLLEGTMPSDDGDLLEGDNEDDYVVELESETDEQVLDDEGSFEDEADYIVMPTENDDDDEDDDATEPSSSESEFDQSYLDDDSNSDSEDIIEEGNLGIPVGNVVTKKFFDDIKSKTSPSCKGKKFYTRAAFLNAAKSYPKFGQLKPDAAAKREIAAFFAHVTHETGSLCYVEEINKRTYCDTSATKWKCVAGKQYYGRGPLQLTWNFNYGPCGKANNFKGLSNPDIVAKNPVIAWKASLWFWMKNVRPVLKNGFAATIKAINGGECNGGNRPAVANRVKYYKAYCKRFKVKPGSNLSC